MRRDHHQHPSILAVLSVDLLILILDKLSEPSDRKSWRLVSRAFLVTESLQRKELKVLRREALPSLLRRYAAALERLDLSACPAIDGRSLATALAAARPLPKLRSLNLKRASGVGWRGLEAIAAACGRLESVDLSHGCGIGDREAAAIAAAAPGLKQLRLDKCLGVTDVGLARVAVGCPQLERLGIKWCLEISDIGIDLLVKKCLDLKELDISYLRVTNKSLQSISTLRKLEVLVMVGCSDIDDQGLEFLNNRSNSLKIIDVSRCINLTMSGLVPVIEGHMCLQKINAGDCFPELPPLYLSKLVVLKDTLNTLRLDGFNVSASSLQIIGGSCKNLVEIGLSKCHGVTDDGIFNLVKCCGKLKTIDLTCCRVITDDSLSAIAKSCKSLSCLLLESCNLISENGLGQIATSCPSLNEIDLTDCSVNDTALKYLSRCSELKALKLGLCPNISDKGLTYMGSKCGKLQQLDLYRTGIGDDGLGAIASGCKKLKKLNLCYCIQITDQGLKFLSCLAELADLELRGLHQITSAGIIALAMGCRSVARLDLKHCPLVDDAGFEAVAQYMGKLRQIIISYCRISDVGLCKLLGSLRCVQDAKLINLPAVTNKGFELALRASCDRLKKLKLLIGRKLLLSPALLHVLETRGCRIRWVDKPLVTDM